MRIHFIAIGGAVMHNLAIALHKKGYIVTGSDDEIREPSRSRLATYNLLPSVEGWQPSLLNNSIDAVILGMHARADNPELLKAMELGLKVYSFPEYLYEQTKNKKRVVIGGSHGKTSVTSMIMHVLKYHHVLFDYMVGSQLDGFETMVGLSQEAELAIFEGDEYLTSPLDLRPKFHLYRPHIAILTGIEWDHINVFPTFDIYKEQFSKFLTCFEPNGKLFYYQHDEHIAEIVKNNTHKITTEGYDMLAFRAEGGQVWVGDTVAEHEVHIFGRHNFQNMNAAMLVCQELGITKERFFEAMTTFQGAKRRLQKLTEQNGRVVFWDFAHAPSKLRATVKAVREFYPDYFFTACFELHTFSSLNEKFLANYKETMLEADEACVCFDAHSVRHKKLPEISNEQVQEGFAMPSLVVTQEVELFLSSVLEQKRDKQVVLLMSSGNFSGVDVPKFASNFVS